MQTIAFWALVFLIQGAYSSEIKKLSLANNKFGFDLHKTFPKDENLFYSPFCISSALAMAYNGARDKTQEEMRTVLGYEYSKLTSAEVPKTFQEYFSLVESPSNYTLEIANAVLVQNNFTLVDNFKTTLLNNFNASMDQVDFDNNPVQIVKKVNDWVKNKTHEKITKLLDEGQTFIDTRLFLLNAVYFEGTWDHIFNKSLTIQASFFNNGLKTKESLVPMMNIVDYFEICKKEKFSALQLPYKGKDIHMLIVLPNENVVLKEIESSINSDMFSNIIQSLRSSFVIVSIPKFKIEYSAELKDNLENIGMKSAFSKLANFSGISQDSRLKMSKVSHKAFLEVNEDGSKAAAVNNVEIVNTSFPPVFIADRPFLFYIYDSRSDLILFSGRLVEILNI